MDYLLYIVLFVFAVGISLFLILRPCLKDKRCRNNVINSDSFMRHYCYRLNCTQAQAIVQLSALNINDKPSYLLDIDSLIMTFSHLGASIPYQLSFYTVENTTYLKVSSNTVLHSKSTIPLMINRFFAHKINAVPVDYAVFEATVNSH